MARSELPIGVDKDNFEAFLAISFINQIEQYREKNGEQIAYLIYQASDHYKDFF